MNSRAPEVAESTQTDGYYCEVPNDPCVVVMFGASGDLARRKLLPALFDLARHACLAPRFRLLGFARTQMSDDEFRGTAGEALAKDGEASRDEDKRLEFLKQLHYFSGNYDDPEAYVRLTRRLDELDRAGQLAGNRLFYLATPPDVYPRIIEQLGRAGLAQPKGENPGRESSSKNLSDMIVRQRANSTGQFSTSSMNRRSIALTTIWEKRRSRTCWFSASGTAFSSRFGIAIMSTTCRSRHRNHSESRTAPRSMNLAGALRDMIQSHMLQLTSLVALEGPATFDATAVRNEKIKVLQSIRPFTRETIWKSVVRGQYGPGTVGGKAVPGYRQEHGVRPDSATDTFVALKLQVDNWRWSGVPFYLRTGKRLAKPRTEVAIQFKKAPHMVFRGGEIEPNSLILYIQPDEGISLSFGAKLPGGQMQIRPVTMDFQYRTAFGGGSRDAYATLINDCIRGDATLFDRADSVEEAWGLVDPILEAWKSASAPPFPNYPAGSEGPRAADDLTLTEGRRWRPL